MEKELKKYFNENGLRFNLQKKRIWNYFDQIFGLERTRELSDIFDETFNSRDFNPSIKYKFCKNFDESVALMYFQSDLILECSQKILNNLIKTKPDKILELGCYNGIFSNFLSKKISSAHVTGIDIQKDLIDFGNEKFFNKNLELIELDYKNLKYLNNRFDYIFTSLGIEEIPHLKYDNYKIRQNQNYNSQLEYFSKFFLSLNNVSKDNTEFLCIIRMNYYELLSIIDAAQTSGWKFIIEELDFINFGSERIPILLFKKKKSDLLNISSLIDKSLEFMDKEENQFYQILLYENDFKRLELIAKDSYKYSETNDELFYKLYVLDEQLALFAWQTNGYVKYKKFIDKDEVKSFFIKEYGLTIGLE